MWDDGCWGLARGRPAGAVRASERASKEGHRGGGASRHVKRRRECSCLKNVRASSRLEEKVKGDRPEGARCPPRGPRRNSLSGEDTAAGGTQGPARWESEGALAAARHPCGGEKMKMAGYFFFTSSCWIRS